MRLRLAIVLGAILAGLMLLSPAALADGDPASDVLLAQNVFYPYVPAVSASLERTLNAETAAAAKAGFPIKVAMIGSPVDLGSIPQLFGQPQKYADFLDTEISFEKRQELLVVMRAGYGVQGLPAAATAAAATLAKPTEKANNGLAAAAITAVAKLAAATGHRIGSFSAASASANGDGGTDPILILVALVIVVVAASLGLIVFRRRRSLAADRG